MRHKKVVQIKTIILALIFFQIAYAQKNSSQNSSAQSLKEPSKSSSLPKRGALPESSKQPPSENIPHGKDLVSIDFPNGVNLGDIIKTVGVWTGKNFILSQGTAGSTRISIISPEPVTKEEAYQAFLSALNIAGFTTVETGSIVKILPIANARSSNIKTYYGEKWAPATDEIINQVIPLKYIDVNTVINQLRTILGTTQVSAFSTTNSLILTDSGNRIRKLLEIIKLLDAKTNQPQVVIEPINYMDAKDAASKVTDIFGSKSGPSLSLQKVIVDERTNSLILVGPASGLDDVVRFIERIDSAPIDQTSQMQIRVRPLDYADAEKLATTLQALTQASSSSNRSSNTGGQQGLYRPPFFGVPPGAPGAPTQDPKAVADLGGAKVTADKATNSLIIQGSKAAYEELNNIISQLDKRRPQVYIEADIVDLNVSNGFSWQPAVLGATTAGGGRYNIPFGFNIASAVPLTVSQTGSSTTSSTAFSGLPAGNAILGILSNTPINLGNGISLTPGALLFALKTDTNINVLQTPSMMVSDNEEANFTSTRQFNTVLPVANPNGQGIVSQPQKYDVNTTLKVTPQISRTDFVNMKIDLQLDDAGAPDATTGFPNPISKRSAKSVLTVQNGQTAVLGGITAEKTTISEAKVPLLGDIPILGWLFKTSTRIKDRANLNLFVTPHIVRDSKDLEKIYKQKIKDRDEFLKVFYGKDFKDEPIYNKLPRAEQGNAPPPPLLNEHDSIDKSNRPFQNQNQGKKSLPLPSQDRAPINAPSSAEGAGGGGGFGFTPQTSPGGVGGHSSGFTQQPLPPSPPPPPPSEPYLPSQ